PVGLPDGPEVLGGQDPEALPHWGRGEVVGPDDGPLQPLPAAVLVESEELEELKLFPPPVQLPPGSLDLGRIGGQAGRLLPSRQGAGVVARPAAGFGPDQVEEDVETG